MDFKLCSSAFSNGEYIPAWYCGDCLNASPPFGWDGEPEGTVSLSLICRSSAGNVHWILWNIPNTMKTVYGKQPRRETLPDGTLQGTNDFGELGWTGPSGRKEGMDLTLHLYAVDRKLDLASGSDAQGLEKALNGHVLGETKLSCACS